MKLTMRTIITLIILITIALPILAVDDNEYIGKKNAAIAKAKEGDGFINATPPDYQNAAIAYENALDRFKDLLADANPADSLQLQIDVLIKNLSVTNRSAGNFEEALDFLDQRLAKTPEDESLYLQKFLILKEDLGKEAVGVKMLEEYLTTHTNVRMATQIANYYYFRAKDYKSAVVWFEYIQVNNPQVDANFYKNIISAYKKVKNYTKVIELSKEYLTINPPESDVVKTYKSIGSAYKSQKDSKNTLIWYEKYLEKKQDPKVALYVCNQYYKKKSNDKTIKYANMVIAKNSKKLVAYFLRGVAKFNKGDKEGAKADFMIAKEDPKYGVHAQKFLDSMK